MAHNGQKAHPKYINIFWWLLGLTIVEVAIVYPEYAAVLKFILFVGVACSKAALVAIYFMHLMFERKTLAVIAITPFLICVFLVIMLMPDLTSEARYEGVAKSAAEAIDTSH